jgi:hypothetical protein
MRGDDIHSVADAVILEIVKLGELAIEDEVSFINTVLKLIDDDGYFKHIVNHFAQIDVKDKLFNCGHVDSGEIEMSMAQVVSGISALSMVKNKIYLKTQDAS